MPTTRAAMGDAIVITHDCAPFGVSLAHLPIERLQVSVSAEKAAKMKRGNWSALLSAGEDKSIGAVYRDVITIPAPSEPPNKLDTLCMLKAFAATLEPIELSMLTK